jgi:hypothetical protein
MSSTSESYFSDCATAAHGLVDLYLRAGRRSK